jgi:hypothetical protein
VTSVPAETYAIDFSRNLTNWSILKSGIAAEGNLTSEVVAAPPVLPEPRFLRVRKE